MNKPEIFLVKAKARYGKEVDLNKVVNMFQEARLNEGVKGGRVELPLHKKITEPLEFELCEEKKKIASVELYHTGTYLIASKDPEFIPLIHEEVIKLLDQCAKKI